MNRATRRLARAALGVGGIALLAVLVQNAGAARVADVLRQAGSWLPLIILLELVQLASDYVALRGLLRRLSVTLPGAAWVRSSAIAYAMMIMLPAGRAAGEVTRAALVSRYAGAPNAARASTELQAAYVFANGLASAAACSVVTSQLGASPLGLLLACNSMGMFALAAALLAVLRDGRVGRWLHGRLIRLGVLPQDGPAPDARLPAHRVPWRAAVVCSASRGVQVVQYGVVLHAVGGLATMRGAFVAHGVHLVGATVGDVLPNQIGVVDGVYRAFAASLGLAGDPARALSIALVARAAQLVVAGACILVAAFTRQSAEPTPEGASPQSIREGVRS